MNIFIRVLQKIALSVGIYKCIMLILNIISKALLGSIVYMYICV